MIAKRNVFFLLTLLFVAALSAYPQRVATATSSGSFELRGAPVNPSNVTDWPVNANDEIAALKTPVTLTFTDGSKVVLGADSKARIEMEGMTPVFHLVSGCTGFALKKAGAIMITSDGQPVTKAAAKGDLRTPNAASCVVPPVSGAIAKGFWTPTNTALVVGGAAAAAGTSAAVVATRGGSSASPSQ